MKSTLKNDRQRLPANLGEWNTMLQCGWAKFGVLQQDIFENILGITVSCYNKQEKEPIYTVTKFVKNDFNWIVLLINSYCKRVKNMQTLVRDVSFLFMYMSCGDAAASPLVNR